MGNIPEKIPELLAPAGNFEKLAIAVHYGADAVYLGGKRYSLRARAANFDTAEIERATRYAHEHGVKVYVTVNIFAHNRDLQGVEEYLRRLRHAEVDGLIISDPGILLISRRTVPEIPIHLSTQANVTNRAGADFWVTQGVHRLNLARELSLDEIREIRSSVAAELEVFVHGALCISYSGRCMLSNYMTGRDANQGDCAHPCRYRYRLEEEKRPGSYFPVEEDERGTYIFNSRDLCLLDKLPRLVAAGIDAVKIEGRMKSVYYVGAVVRLYRAALDRIRRQLESGEAPDPQLPKIFAEEIAKVGTRGATSNFFENPPQSGDMLYDAMRERQPHVPVGIVRGTDPLVIETRNVLETGDRVEYLGRDPAPLAAVVVAMHDQDGKPLQRANPCTRVTLTMRPPPEKPAINALLRKKESFTEKPQQSTLSPVIHREERVKSR